MERYRPLIENWREFKQASRSHPINSVRRNPIKSRENFFARLGERFDFVERSEWSDSFYRLPGTEQPGKSLMHWLGEYYVQEESAGLPVEGLNPREEEKILDLCAAPGGKTTQIAGRIGNQGEVVANDKSGKRLQSLTSNIYRTGSYCVSTSNYDGRRFPGYGRFDRVLVDAPCSGEGDRCRRNFQPVDRDESKNLSDLQLKLMERASELVRSGGVVVYSTCTISPFENERVVHKTLENTQLELEEFSVNARHSNGVESFENNEYGSEMEKTLRIYPHHFGSGVIFVAKFRK